MTPTETANHAAAARRYAAAHKRALEAIHGQQQPSSPPKPKPSRAKPRGQSLDAKLEGLERDLTAHLKRRGIDPKLAARTALERTEIERPNRTDPERASQLAAMDHAFGLTTHGPAVQLSGTTQTFSALSHGARMEGRVTSTTPAQRAPQVRPSRSLSRSDAAALDHRAQMDAAMGIVSREPAVKLSGATQTFSALGLTRR